MRTCFKMTAIELNPSSTEVFKLEVVSRFRDPQLQVTENACDLYNRKFQNISVFNFFYFKQLAICKKC